jgi:release factor H-coupled RctB family protein
MPQAGGGTACAAHSGGVLRATVVANHDRGSASVVVLAREPAASLVERVRGAARNKLQFKAKRFFVLPCGRELLAAGDAALLSNGITVVCSRGEALSGREAGGGPVEAGPRRALLGRVLAVSAWLDPGSVEQMHGTARRLAGVRLCVGMPDLHPGKRFPIGAVFATQGVIYPALVGGDIGCGMALVRTPLKARDLSGKALDRMSDKLAAGMEVGGFTSCDAAMSELDRSVPWGCNDFLSAPPGRGGEDCAGPVATRPMSGAASLFRSELPAEGLGLGAFHGSLGTVGGGNHFAELQVPHRVYDETLLLQCGLDAEQAVLLVHSGSRGLGQALLERHEALFGDTGLEVGSAEADTYLALHDAACEWARHNRRLIARRFLRCLGCEQEPHCVLDVWHNHVAPECCRCKPSAGEPWESLAQGADAERERERESESEAEAERERESEHESEHESERETKEMLWLHRKGAAPSTEGPVVIPGSRGTLSYLVLPVSPRIGSAFSLAHGAGRKWHREKAHRAGKARYPDADALRRTNLGGRVVCSDKALLYEEAPEAYKCVDAVVKDLVDQGFVTVIASFRPLLTFKTAAQQAG